MAQNKYRTRLVTRTCARCSYVASARTYDKATDSMKDHLIATHLSVLRTPVETPITQGRSSDSL